jgi:phosphoglycolate phosphatase-like HAD superfamily hydrolase
VRLKLFTDAWKEEDPRRTEEPRGNVKKISLVITDLDNTLFDWFEIWYQPFNAMLDALAGKSGIPREAIERNFRQVHQRHGTSEYAFAIEELQCLKELHPGDDLAKRYAGAIDAYRAARRKVLQLFPTVEATLREIKDSGCLVVAYTESMEFYTRYRLKKLGLDPLLDYLYSPRDHRLPGGLTPEQIRFYSDEHYLLSHTKQFYTPPGELKPNPKVLIDIIDQVGGQKESALYVGDSLMKDVTMAKRAGVTDVYAKYGIAHNRAAYDLLRRVTHWPDSDVEREKELGEDEVNPGYVLETHFEEILDHFDFGRFHGQQA